MQTDHNCMLPKMSLHLEDENRSSYCYRAREDRIEEEGSDIPSSPKNTFASLWCNRPEHDVTGEKFMTTIKTGRAKTGGAAFKVLRG